MKYFKDFQTNDVYAYEADGSQDEFILTHLVPITDAEAKTLSALKAPKITVEETKKIRQKAYIFEADPLFFKVQRGEATKEEWLAKVEEIKLRFPLPVN